MSSTRIIQYIHRPNKTELGQGNTHEAYMLIDSKTDVSDLCPPGVEVLVTDPLKKRTYRLKSAKGNEFRVNQMGPIYRDYDIKPGDEIILTQYKKGEDVKNILSVNTYNRVCINTKGEESEIVNIDRLLPFSIGERKYTFPIMDNDVEKHVEIEFLISKKKRSDSPSETDYYKILVDGEPLSNGLFYFNISDVVTKVPFIAKSEFNKVVLTDYLSTSCNDTIKRKQQVIFFGAPGTGKSHKIKDEERVKVADEKNMVFRTTFHPDSDYSTFVGAYKPTMRPVADKYKAVAGKDEEITYEFVPQAFLQAYIAAWDNQNDNIFLVIEEINRGNCAQIFGDLFQLLDRDNEGFSEYPIKADRDLAKYLNGKDDKGNEILGNKEGIKDGKLKLPKNLYIWATMNTSDQSLFPIDSAFKRRWDWQYMPIEDAGKNWKIEVNGHEYDWWGFLIAINKEVFALTHSEDKQLGYFFAKAENNKIDAQTLVNKVYFYLWTDVFKDYEFESQKAFKKADGNDAIAFKDFFKNGEVDEVMAEQVLINLGLNKPAETEE